MIAWVRRLVLIARTRFEGLLGSRWRFREAAAGQSAGQSAGRSAGRSVDRSSAQSAPTRPADVRMVPLAAASWGSAWLGTSEVPAGIAAAATGLAVGLAVAALRRSALALTVALVTAVVLCATLVDMHRLRHGPVAVLATHQAVVSADVEIRADPHRVAETGLTSGAAVVRAAIVRIEGRGGSWLVRAPVLVIVTGPRLEEWLRMPVGTRVVVDGRMESPRSRIRRGCCVTGTQLRSGCRTALSRPSSRRTSPRGPAAGGCQPPGGAAGVGARFGAR